MALVLIVVRPTALIARSLIADQAIAANMIPKNALILVLDEATSALDGEAEAAIQACLGVLTHRQHVPAACPWGIEIVNRIRRLPKRHCLLRQTQFLVRRPSANSSFRVAGSSGEEVAVNSRAGHRGAARTPR